MSRDEIIEKAYFSSDISRYCRSLTKEWEELKSQMMMQLMKMKESKLLEAHSNGYLEYLCFTICKRIIYGNISGTGIFYKSSRSVSMDESLVPEIADFDAADDRLDLIESILSTKHWYDKTLFNYHYKDGYKLREISEMTGINMKSIAYTIDKTRKEIKKKIKDGNNDYDR